MEGGLDLMGKGVTKMASRQLESSLSLIKGYQKASWIMSYYTHGQEFGGSAGPKQSVLLASKWTKHPA